jgi:hypothetical protein
MKRTIVQRILRESFPQVDSDDPVSYFGEAGNAVDAVMYGWLYWPDLVELHGAVFLALDGDDEADIAERLATPVANGHPDWPELSWVEAVDSFNIFEVEHLFGQWRGSVELYGDVHRELGRFLVHAWTARLVTAYQERRFTVILIDADDLMGLRIEVSQRSPALVGPEGWDARRRGIITDSGFRA